VAILYTLNKKKHKNQQNVIQIKKNPV